MENVQLRIGFGKYDRHQGLVDGSTKIQGVDAQYETHQIITEVFERMVRQRIYDIGELGLSYFLRTLDLDDPPFLAIPVFPVRVFRHSAIYINTDSGITKPEDLAGKTIGEFAMYGHDAGVWPKGILSDDFGLKPEQCRWCDRVVGLANETRRFRTSRAPAWDRDQDGADRNGLGGTP